MNEKVIGIEAIKKVAETGITVRINLGGSKFTTKILHYDRQDGIFFTDELTPKAGNDQLTVKQNYEFTSEFFESGTIYNYSIAATLTQKAKLNKLPTLIFSIPEEANSRTILYEVEPKKNENILVSLIVRNQRIYEPITRLNIRSLQFPCASSIRITEDSSLINNVKLKFPTFEVGFSAKISRMTLYLYQLEFTDLQLEEFQKINKYLWDRYKESIVGVLKLEKDAPTTAVHTAIFSKPKIEAPQFKAKILLADDEILFTDLLSRFLQQKGYHCFAVNEAREILDRAIRYKPDLIILDLKMPDYDGITICRRLKRNPATVQIPVIMMTGSNIKDDIIESKEAGAQDYVLKSADLDLELLLKRIENILKT